MKSLIASTAGMTLGVVNSIFLRRSLVVFCYHDVSDTPSEFSRDHDLNVPPALFERQLQFIQRNFTIVHPRDLLSNKELPAKAALITFDDGFKSVTDNAVPMLERHKIPAMFFLNMAAIRGEVFWSGLITYLCTKTDDFKDYLRHHSSETRSDIPIFLTCTKEIVDSYLQQLGHSIEDDVRRYVGAFATPEDLERVSGNGYMSFGNHLFNHYVPRVMSDDDFYKCYLDNDEALQAYPNHLKMFSFPFGQPDTCFRPGQVDLLRAKGVPKVFCSSGRFNRDQRPYCLDRLALTSFHDSPSKIWFQIFKKSIKGGLPLNRAQ